ncbi:MAG TPA: cyclase family protein [Thermoleophilaceae bacterium]|nr:cyclase family protein [Thermoleophilaceae bacterium]
MTRPPTRVSADEFQALFRSLSEWRRWGKDDERGALHHLTRERVATAARLVRDGITVTLSLPVATERAPSNPVPAEHRMTMLFDTDIGSGSERFAKDYIGVDYHNDGHTHIDAFCHVAYEGALYNGRPQDTVTSAGAAADAIEVLKDGLVGRGVLLDIPRVRGVAWLEPGEHIFRDDLEAAEREQGVRLGAGDILLVRTGHVRRLRELGPWDTASAKAGLHPTAMPLIAERGIAALGSDGNSDTAPSTTDGVAFPIHVLALNAMGVHLLDYLQFEDLRVACEQTGRWAFFFAAAPLRIPRGTGSPINPTAIL